MCAEVMPSVLQNIRIASTMSNTVLLTKSDDNMYTQRACLAAVDATMV